jgi:predicted secreted acid phosphatase
MKHSRLIVLALLFLSLGAQAKIANNLNSHPQGERLRDYYQSGRYYKEMEQTLFEAKSYLRRQAKDNRPNQLAIVLDIDETALSNYQDLERLYFTRNPQALTAAYMLAGADPISPVLELYQEAINNNVAVFFVSERPSTPEIMSVTVNNLRKAGFEKWQEVILKPIDNDQSIQDFKTKARKHIAAQGFDIILNVGDQNSDLQGGYAEVKIKIPNPFYEIS